MKTIEEHNENVSNKRKEALRKKYKTGVECPNCKNELFYTHIPLALVSPPKQLDVVCYDCLYKTKIEWMK